MNFDIKTEQLSDRAYVISLAGEVDLYTAPEFKQQLLEVIAQGARRSIVDFTRHDVHRLDDARRARRRRQAPADERRPALARLQRPQHHEDLRDHRPRPGVLDLRQPRRGGRGRSTRSCRPLRRPARASALGTCSSPWRPRRRLRRRRRASRDRGDAAAGKELFKAKCGACHTLADAGHDGRRSARTSTTPSRSTRRRASTQSDDPRPRPRPDRLRRERPGRPDRPRHAAEPRARAGGATTSPSTSRSAPPSHAAAAASSRNRSPTSC